LYRYWHSISNTLLVLITKTKILKSRLKSAKTKNVKRRKRKRSTREIRRRKNIRRIRKKRDDPKRKPREKTDLPLSKKHLKIPRSSWKHLRYANCHRLLPYLNTV
jgi:hypothetical protein